MKKLMIAALALGLSASAFAIDYEPEEGLTYQINAGMTISSITNFNVAGVNHGGGKVGATFGIKADYVLPNAAGTYLSAGIDWAMKGCSRSGKEAGLNISDLTKSYDITETKTLHYIQIPIHVGFRYNLLEDIGFYGEFGPYFAMGVNARNSFDIDYDGSWATDKEKDLSYNAFSEQSGEDLQYAPYFQIWDFGIGFRVGAEYDNHYSLNIGMDWGITDMLRDKYRNKMADNGLALGKPRNFSTYISLGYRF